MPAAAAARHRRQASCEAVHNANLLCEPGARRGRAGRAGARQVDMGPRAGSTTIAAMDSFRQGLSGLRDPQRGVNARGVGTHGDAIGSIFVGCRSRDPSLQANILKAVHRRTGSSQAT